MFRIALLVLEEPTASLCLDGLSETRWRPLRMCRRWSVLRRRDSISGMWIGVVERTEGTERYVTTKGYSDKRKAGRVTSRSACLDTRK